MAFRTLRFAEIEPVRAAGLHWLPLRHLLGVQAFGVNAYTAAAAGEDVIEEHTEEGLGTTVLAVGGKPGEGYEVSAWEWRFRAVPHHDAGDWAGAEALIRESLEAHPGDGASVPALAGTGVAFRARPAGTGAVRRLVLQDRAGLPHAVRASPRRAGGGL